MKNQTINLNYIIVILSFSIAFTNCGGDGKKNENRLSQSTNDFMTKNELLVLQHAVTYAKGKKDEITNKEAIPVLEEFFQTYDSEPDSNPSCVGLTVDDIIELVSSENRSKYLRSKGFYLYDIGTIPSRRISVETDVNRNDILTWGRCRFQAEKEHVGGRAGILHFLAEGLDYGDYFKENIRTTNVIGSEIDIFQYENILNELKNKGKRLIVEKYNIHSLPSGETYEYKGFYWLRYNRVGSGESSLAVIAKQNGHEIMIFSCSFFKENKVAELLNWEESKIVYVPVNSRDKRVRLCQFNYPDDKNYFSFGVNDKFLSGLEPKDLKSTYQELVSNRGYRYLSKKGNSSMIIGKMNNQFGFNKWNFDIKYQKDNKREFLIGTLSKTEDNPKLEKMMVDLIKKLAEDEY